MAQVDSPEALSFASFRLDLRAGRLMRAGETVPLRPKTWSVLVHLARRPGELVTKADLLDAVWPDVAVTPDTLTKSIGELRLALGDDSKTPRYIETVHRRGFRFIAEAQESAAASAPTGSGEDKRESADPRAGNRLIGREAELGRLEELLAKARAGERQIAFVTGPPGIGKSALVEAFLHSPAVRAGETKVWIGRGVCVEQHGAREAYMPVLEALERLARRSDSAPLKLLLRQAAPAWLLQMPWLIGDDASATQQSLRAAGPECMLREFATLIETLTSDITVVLVLEDLHWSDPSTVDLLSFLAQRREPARLFVVGSYRPAEAAVREHPLPAVAHRLKARRQCVEIPLHELTTENVQGYLEGRFPDAEFSASLAPVLQQHTDGNPLFMIAVVEHMLARGLILDTAPGWALSAPLERVDLGIPDDVGQMVEAQIETLSPADRELLEVASVNGVEFAVPAAAAVLGADAGAVEMHCEALARARRFLRAVGRTEWPDGSATRRYAFTHELYRRVVYAGIPDRQRSQLHRSVAEALEAAYGDRRAEIASVLAVHFERCRDHARAVRFLTLAGVRARQRLANREALGYFESALAAVARVSDRDVRRRGELEVRLVLGPALSDLDGYASDRVRENYERADDLCARAGGPEEEFEIVYALCHFHTARASLAAEEMAARLDALAKKIATADARLRADSVLVRIALVAARFGEAQAHMQDHLALDSVPRSERAWEFGPDPVIDANLHSALALWFLGYEDRARAAARAGIEASRASGASFTLAGALSLGAVLEILRDNPADALALAEEAARVSEEQGFAYLYAMATAVRGHARVLRGEIREGIDELVRARSALHATGTRVFSAHILAFLADAYRRNLSPAKGLAAANEGLGLAESTLDRNYRSELWRLKGELLLAMGQPGRRGQRVNPASLKSRRREAERCLMRAWELARETEARSSELRAAISLARLCQASGRVAQAKTVLAPVCDWFGREAQGPVLDDARSLLDELRRSDRARSKAGAYESRSVRRKISANLPRTFRI